MKKPNLHFLEKFKRKRKEKEIFNKVVENKEQVEVASSKTKTILKPVQIQPVKERKVWKIPGLRKFKRIMAAFWLFLDGLFLWSALTAGIVPIAIIFFIGVAFLLLDYLWKTKRVKIEVDW